MRLSRFTGAQITGVTKEKEAGLATVEVCRRHGPSRST
jgi:putative transposase